MERHVQTITPNAKIIFIIVFLFCFLSGNQIYGQEIKAHPHRSAYSSSTVTTDPRTFELEGGLTVNPDLQNTPVLLKYGIKPGLEVFTGISPFVKLFNLGQKGVGDLSLGTRCRFIASSDGATSAGFQFIWKVPTANEHKGLGSGRSDFDLTVILSRSYSKYSIDANLGGFWAGIQSTSRFEKNIYGDLTVSRILKDRISMFVDGYTYRNFSTDRTTLLGAIGIVYTVHPAFLLDLTTNINIRNGPYNWQILAGGVINLFGFK